jgi:hypothetical protein
MSIKYYYHLDLPNLPEKYIIEGINAKYELNKFPRLYWANSTFNETNFFKQVNEKFGDCYVKYYLNPPDSFYDWHVDQNRYCTINWIVKTNKEASTLYREPIEGANEGRDPIFFHVNELKYRNHKPTLLNATHEHCVVNNFPDTRIILSMSLFKPTRYEDVIIFLQNMKCDEY